MSQVAAQEAQVLGVHLDIGVSRPAGRARPARRVGADDPWEYRVLVVTSCLFAFGLSGLVLSWYAVSGEREVRDQVPWLAAGVGAALLCGLATVLWVVSGMRTVHRELRILRRELGRGGAPETPAEPDGAPAALVSADRMTLFHLVGCPYVQGKQVHAIDEPEISRRGLRPCKVCRG